MNDKNRRKKAQELAACALTYWDSKGLSDKQIDDKVKELQILAKKIKKIRRSLKK